MVYIHNDFESNMGRIPPGYTSSHWCVKLKSATKKNFFFIKKTKKNKLLTNSKEFDSRTHFNIYILILGITAKYLNQKGRIWHVLSKTRVGIRLRHVNGCGFAITVPTGSHWLEKLIEDLSGQNLACGL